MTTTRRNLLLASGALALGTRAFAQAFPAKPIRLIYTYAAGGSGDATARAVAASMSGTLGQQVLVENRAGGSGSIGLQAVWRSPADGYTLMMTTITTVVQYPLITKDTSFDPAGSMVPVGNLAMNPLVLVVHPSLPVTDFNSFVDWARRQSGGVEVAVSGPTLEVAAALLGQRTGIKLNTVKYRGGAPALQALLGGEPKVFFDAANAALISNAREGKVRVIGVTSAEVSPLLPDAVPIARHLPGFVQDINFAIWAPPGTPPAVTARLRESIDKALAEPDMKDRFLKAGVVVAPGGPDFITSVTLREAAAIKRAMELTPISYGS